MAGLFFLFFYVKLVVSVREDGIWYRYPPIIMKEKLIRKDSIEKFEIRKYRPVMQYGGWGVRTGSRKYGKAYNVKGNIGMQLYLKDGKRILFGTERKESFQRAMVKIMGETKSKTG